MKRCFKTLKPARCISPKCFEKKPARSPSDELFLHFSAKVQNLAVFSFIYMIRIRFFGPGELIQKYFRAARYKCPSASDNQAETIASSETNRIPADRGVLAETRVFRGARFRSATRAPSTHSRGPNLTKEELQQRKRTEREERRSMGTLPKATDSHAENKRKLRDEVHGKGTGRHPQQ